MRRRFLSVSLVLGLVVAAVWASPASADSERKKPKRHGGVFLIDLTGSQEVPQPGDPDGVGTAVVQVGPGNFVCYRIAVRNVDMPTAAHIHIGVRGEAGPIVVPNGGGSLPGTWAAGSNGSFVLEGCVADSDARTIRAHPAGFYVNVHNAAFPAGAVRGQLR